MDKEHRYPNRRRFLKTITSATVGASLWPGSRLLKTDRFSLLRSCANACLQPEQVNPQQLTTSRYEINPFLGTSAAIRRLEQDARKIVATQQPILIEGEMGTGKSVLARWIHRSGPRSEEAFVESTDQLLNRNIIPVSGRARRLMKGLFQNLAEPILFGYDKGPFTGASRPGLVEIAHRGVLFLNDIGDLDRMVQPKLLKLIENKSFRRFGDVRERVADVQVIGATNHDLMLTAKEMEFGEDLYSRISTFRLRVPPLRERIEDIPVLANTMLCTLASGLVRGPQELSKAAEIELKAYSWPGNIRELQDVVAWAALYCDNRMIEPGDLGLDGDMTDTPDSMAIPDRELTELDRWRIFELWDKLAANGW